MFSKRRGNGGVSLLLFGPLPPAPRFFFLLTGALLLAAFQLKMLILGSQFALPHSLRAERVQPSLGVGTVQHLALQGELKGIQGTAHIFVKALESVTNPAMVSVRGFVYFERIFLAGDWVGLAPAQVRLQLVANGSVAEDVYTPQTACLHELNQRTFEQCKARTVDPHRYPEFLLFLRKDTSYALHAPGWNRSVSLDFVLAAAAPRRLAEGPREVVHVQTPLFFTPHTEPRLRRLLEVYIAHNRQRGISGTVLFSRQRLGWGLEGLHVLPWAWPLYEGHPYLDQMAVYNFAILTYWGSHTLLLMADMDEFLAVPEGTDLERLVGRCLTGLRYNVFAEGADFWHAAEPVRTLRRRAAVWDSWKSVVDPDYVFSYYIHEGAVCHHEPAPCADFSSCRRDDRLFFAHAFNLINNRTQPRRDDVIDESWQW